MKYRRALIIIIAALLLASPASGADFLLSSRIQSQYIAGNGAVFHDKPVLQSDLLISWKSGIYADLWHSSSLEFDNWNKGSDDELDYIVGWSKSFGSLTVDTGALYMNFVDLNESRGDGIFPYLEISRTPQPKKSISPYLKVQPAFPVKGGLPKKGCYFAAGLNMTQQQKKSGPETRQKISVIYDTGAFGYEENTIGEYKFEMSYSFGKRTKIHLPSVSAYIPLSKPSDLDGRKTSVSVGTGLSVSF